MLEIKTLSPKDVPLVVQCLGKHPRQNCDYSIVNILTWGRLYRNQ